MGAFLCTKEKKGDETSRNEKWNDDFMHNLSCGSFKTLSSHFAI